MRAVVAAACLLVAAGAAQAQSRERMSPAIAPKVAPLAAADGARLARARTSAAARLDSVKRLGLVTAAGKLAAVKALIATRTSKPGQADVLEGLDVLLGDAMAQGLGMEWVTAETRAGYRGPALRQVGFDLVVFPIGMVSGRLAKGEPVDVDALYQNVAVQVRAAR